MEKKWFETGQFNFSVGIEDTFVPQSRPGMRALDEYELTKHYEQWYSDLGLIPQIGANQCRWGIPWYLVNPAPHVFRFDWLDRVIDRFNELGIEVIVDLMHYGTPLWLDNSFLNHDYPAYVAEYAHTIAQRYRGRLSVFTPLNESILNIMYCGEFAYWPPYLAGDSGFVMLLRQISRGMAQTQMAIADANPDATFVNVEATFRFGGDKEAFEEEVTFLENRRFITEDLLLGKVDNNHALVPWLSQNGYPDDDLQWHFAHPVIPDVMGVNYYPQVSTVKYSRGEHHSGSPYDPMPFQNDGVEGLNDALKLYWNRYGIPVYLTETSWPGPVNERMQWLRDSVDAVARLRADGIPVVGYTWWSLFDMIYWTYRDENKPVENYLAQMGLWDLVPDDRLSFKRVRTEAADEYFRLVQRYRDEL